MVSRHGAETALVAVCLKPLLLGPATGPEAVVSVSRSLRAQAAIHGVLTQHCEAVGARDERTLLARCASMETAVEVALEVMSWADGLVADAHDVPVGIAVGHGLVITHPAGPWFGPELARVARVADLADGVFLTASGAEALGDPPAGVGLADVSAGLRGLLGDGVRRLADYRG